MGVVTLGSVLAVACAFFGLLVGFEDDWDSTTGQVVFVVLALLGAAVLLAGLYYSRRRGRRWTWLIIVGALISGFMIWWTIVAPFVAIAVIVLAILWMRRPGVAVD